MDVWLRRWSGQLIHEIAAAYVINQGRVSDVLNEKTHIGTKEAAESTRSAEPVFYEGPPSRGPFRRRRSRQRVR